MVGAYQDWPPHAKMHCTALQIKKSLFPSSCSISHNTANCILIVNTGVMLVMANGACMVCARRSVDLQRCTAECISHRLTSIFLFNRSNSTPMVCVGRGVHLQRCTTASAFAQDCRLITFLAFIYSSSWSWRAKGKQLIKLLESEQLLKWNGSIVLTAAWDIDWNYKIGTSVDFYNHEKRNCTL